MFKQDYKIAVIGLGYVGLPLAVELAKHFTVVGFDVNHSRVNELKNCIDSTMEVEEATLRASSLHITADATQLTDNQIFIVTVPTPVDNNNQPDLNALRLASTTVGKFLQSNSVVVYESTVYPGVTEDFCGPILEKSSGLIANKDFFLGYSPERINPGDKVHKIYKITKVVAGQNEHTANLLAEVYGKINDNNIFIAKNIKSAEAAKVIENAQRDINIAFINEITMVFSKIGISVYDVLDAANTKWNFLPFTPGLVGGHCIGVDPYYLAHAAIDLGHDPKVILSGREINEAMANNLAQNLHKKLQEQGFKSTAKVLILGLTFKEDVPDLRNTKVVNFINALQKLGYSNIAVHDPLADGKLAKDLYEIDLHMNFDQMINYDVVVSAVPHKVYKEMGLEALSKLFTKNGGLLADLKAIWRHQPLPQNIQYWTL